MTDKEILQKAIEKARNNGYPCLNLDDMEYIILEEIIFDHDFAKAFWGEEGIIKSIPEYEYKIKWKKKHDKSLGTYYYDQNCKKFLKQKNTCHQIFKKNGKYVVLKSDPYEDYFEEIELGTRDEYPIAFDYGYWCEGWKEHLKELVLEKKPLKYLEKFL